MITRFYSMRRLLFGIAPAILLVLENGANLGALAFGPAVGIRHSSRSSISPTHSGMSARDEIDAASISSSTKSSPLNARRLEQSLQRCKNSRQAQSVLKEALGIADDSQKSVLFNSISVPPGASAKGISDGDLAIQARLANKKYKITELIELSGDRDADRASLALLCLTISSSTSAIVANQNLPGPQILRFMVVWVLTFAPFFFVGYGIATPEKLQAVLVSIQRELFPAYRQRMLQHEAGHFLIAHLLGYPIEGYKANAVKNAVQFYPLRDTEMGNDRARQLGFDAPLRDSDGDEEEKQGMMALTDASFYGPGGRGERLLEEQSVFRNAKNYTENPFLKLPSQSEPTKSWPYRGFNEATLDQLSVISLAGVCAEILAFGNAEGGIADLSQLRQIFASAEEEIPEREVENRIRFALGYTISQLRLHLGALDSLAEVMERDGSIAECILAIERCENVNGQDGIMGDYERRRREQFRQDKAGILERIFLGSDKNIDQDEDRLVTGKGGGYRKEEFRLTGDDPLYAAGALALGFFIWASSGGLSLH